MLLMPILIYWSLVDFVCIYNNTQPNSYLSNLGNNPGGNNLTYMCMPPKEYLVARANLQECH